MSAERVIAECIGDAVRHYGAPATQLQACFARWMDAALAMVIKVDGACREFGADVLDAHVRAFAEALAEAEAVDSNTEVCIALRLGHSCLQRLQHGELLPPMRGRAN